MTSTLTTAVDVAAVRDVVRAGRAVASVYLGPRPVPPSVDSGEQLSLRWRAIAARLHADGADEPTVAVVGEHLATLPAYAPDVALFAAAGDVILRQDVEVGVPTDLARFAAPAHVAPLLSWLWRHPPYVEVVTDRTGAEVTAVTGGSLSGATETVVGPDDEWERNAPGGWAQARYQRRAEDSWRHNAGAVADAVVRALAAVDADLLLVAGDVRAVQLLRERLPDGVRRGVSVRDVPGGRQPDGSESTRRASVAAVVAAHAAKRRSALLARTHAELARGTAVEGATATLAALAEGRVHTLLVADDPYRDERTALFGEDLLGAPDPGPAAPGRPESTRRGRLVDVATRAALLTGAQVCVLAPNDSPNLAGRIGALCRFSPAPVEGF